jgi:hypothetical protein
MLAVAMLVAGGAAGAAVSKAEASARAFGVRVVVPGKPLATAGSIVSPPQSAASLVDRNQRGADQRTRDGACAHFRVRGVALRR